jgi:hypothetical protein
MPLSCVCCVLSGRGLCVELITRPESPVEGGVSEYDHEVSIVRNRHSRAFLPWREKMMFREANINYSKGKGKAVPLQAWSVPEGSRKLRFPDYMTMAQDDGKVVSLTQRPPLLPGNTPGIHFCRRLSRPQGHNAIGRIMSMKNSNDTNWNRTSDLPICSAVP